MLTSVALTENLVQAKYRQKAEYSELKHLKINQRVHRSYESKGSEEQWEGVSVLHSRGFRFGKLANHLSDGQALVSESQTGKQIDGRFLVLPARRKLPEISGTGAGLGRKCLPLLRRQLWVEGFELHEAYDSAPLPPLSIADRYLAPNEAPRLTLMKTSQEIRRENLALLVKEAGTPAALARICKVPAPYISQLRNQVANESGKVRTMGDDTARKFERGMNKPVGWLDADHSAAPADLAEVEAEVAGMLRALDADNRRAVLYAVRGIFNGQQEVSERTSPKVGSTNLDALRTSRPSHVPGRKTNVQSSKRKPNAL